MTVDLKLAARQVATSTDARRQSAAFAAIVEHTQAPLYRYASRLMGNLAAAACPMPPRDSLSAK